METETQLAPLIVSVMVVHHPDDSFDDTLASLAAQTYPNIRSLFLIDSIDDGEVAELTERITAVLPGAFVRRSNSHNGFGSVASEALDLVDGDKGFFLICQDDIALSPSTIRLLVEELYRSNAGIVGPKLVDWDEPASLQHVGLGLDRFGEPVDNVTPGERDQEQHDAVTDVFAVPSACFLIRADLFRSLGGFDPAITYHGEDVELCWRAHLTGARVMVAPQAVVRHREQLVERRPDLDHRALANRHRVRTVATLTGARRLPFRLLALVVAAVVEMVVGLFTGRFRDGWASLRALVGLIGRTGSIIARRRQIRSQRVVPDREIVRLQRRGSARLSAFISSRDLATYVGGGQMVRRWRETSFGPTVTWLAFLALLIIGSRTFIRSGIPAVGEFLPFPDSPSDLVSTYRQAFDGRGFGASASLPTGLVTLALMSILTLFRMSLFQTWSIIALAILGALGIWRLTTIFPAHRARVAGIVVYVGAPLLPTLLGGGRLSGLIVFAVLPWLVHLTRRLAGIATADPSLIDDGIVDERVALPGLQRVRLVAILSLVVGLAAAFVPAIVPVWLLVGAVISIATLATGGSWRVAAWLAGGAVISSVMAFLLNLPWSLTWTSGGLAVPPQAGAGTASMIDTATLAQVPISFGVLAIALYLPLIAALMITRAWRLTWAVRGLFIAVGAGLFMVKPDWIRFAPADVLAVPVVLGIAVGAAAVAGGFGLDIRARGFGWRQPVGVLANVAIAVGVLPAVIMVGSGNWGAPQITLPSLVSAQAPLDPVAGDYRVLFVGDPQILPVPSRSYAPGVAYAVVDSGGLDITDRFATPVTPSDEVIVEVLDLIAHGSSLRAGKLLAPLGIRYVVIPLTDGVVSTESDPLAVPDGLLNALSAQLDLAELYGPPSISIFDNQSWIPVGAHLSGATAEASTTAGNESVSRADLNSATPILFGADHRAPRAIGPVDAGVIHLAIPFDDGIQLTVDGQVIEPRPSFGTGMAFDVVTPGEAKLSYVATGNRQWWIALQLAIWLIGIGTVLWAGIQMNRRPVSLHHTAVLTKTGAPEPVIELGSGPAIAGDPLTTRIDVIDPPLEDQS